MAKSFSEFPIVETIHEQPENFANRGATNPAVRGRFGAPPEIDVLQLAISIKENGQQQAVIARRSADGNQLHILEGFTRVDAIHRIRDGFTITREDGSERTVKPDPNFLVRVSIVDCDDETATVLNITGNSQRSNLSCMDKASNVGRLAEMKDAKGKGLYSGKAIADMLRINPTDVSRLKGLLDLPDCAKARLHDGRIPYSVGIELAKESNELKEAEIVALVETPRKDADGAARELNLQDVREYLRARKEGEPAKKTETETETETESQSAQGGKGKGASTARTKAELIKHLTSTDYIKDKNSAEYDSLTETQKFVSEVFSRIELLADGCAASTFDGAITRLVNRLDAKILKVAD